MQARKDDLNYWLFFFRMQSYRNAATVVFYSDRAVLAQRDVDPSTKARKNLIGCIIDNLLHDMQRAFGARVHPGSLPDGLEPLEYANRFFAVIATAPRRALTTLHRWAFRPRLCTPQSRSRSQRAQHTSTAGYTAARSP